MPHGWAALRAGDAGLRGQHAAAGGCTWDTGRCTHTSQSADTPACVVGKQSWGRSQRGLNCFSSTGSALRPRGTRGVGYSLEPASTGLLSHSVGLPPSCRSPCQSSRPTWLLPCSRDLLLGHTHVGLIFPTRALVQVTAGTGKPESRVASPLTQTCAGVLDNLLIYLKAGLLEIRRLTA